MPLQLTVIIPTHNPDPRRFERVLFHLQSQSLPKENWELIVVDNASDDENSVSQFDLSWHSNVRMYHEPQLGLSHARIAGFRRAQGSVLVFVDDDNLLDESYLQNALHIMNRHEDLGACGGKSLPSFETPPAQWVREFDTCLALRDFGDEVEMSYPSDRIDAYPECSPIGAGMVVRKEAFSIYCEAFSNSSEQVLDRTGKNLASSGDNDLVLHILKGGWRVGYFPELRLEHIIPASRITRNYLAKLNYATSRSWIKVLHKHGVLPWGAIPASTVTLRKCKAFWQYRAFLDPARYVRWRGACGMYEALSEL